MDSPIQQQLRMQKQQSIQRIQDKNDHQDQNKGQVSRRSRKDTDGRDYKCGCGKKYLSYPALYTHIKTKHDGRQPQGTVKYSTAVPAKKAKSKIQQQHLNQIITLVKKQDIRLLNELGPDYTGYTQISSRIKNKILTKQITDCYHSLLKNPISPLTIGKQNTLEQHLVIYLIGVGQFVGQKLHQYYQWFAKSVRQCYYQAGNQVYNKCFSKKQGGIGYIPKFKLQQVKYFPMIADFYIRFFLPYQYMELNHNVMELILSDFCAWLLKRQSTLIQVVMNKQYNLIKKLQLKQDQKIDKQEKNKDQNSQKIDQSQLDQHQNNQNQQNQHQNQQQQNHNKNQSSPEKENHLQKQLINQQAQNKQINNDKNNKIQEQKINTNESLVQNQNIQHIKQISIKNQNNMSLNVEIGNQSEKQIIEQPKHQQYNQSQPIKAQQAKQQEKYQFLSENNLQ